MKAVQVDSGPLYAIAIQSDQYHVRSQEELSRLAAERSALLVIYPILFEAHNLILRRTSPSATLQWLRRMADGVIIVNPLETDYEEAVHRVQGYPDQPITLFDALLGVVSERLTLPVWTYDHHFDVMRVSVWR